MISVIAMASALAIWFYKLWLIASTGVVTPIAPLMMLGVAMICAGRFGWSIHRRLS